MGECLLYSKFPPGEYLLHSKVSGGKVYYIANISRGIVYYIVIISGEGLLYDTGRHCRFRCVGQCIRMKPDSINIPTKTLRLTNQRKQRPLSHFLTFISNLTSMVNFCQTLWQKRRLQFYQNKFSTPRL